VVSQTKAVTLQRTLRRNAASAPTTGTQQAQSFSTFCTEMALLNAAIGLPHGLSDILSFATAGNLQEIQPAVQPS
jgi:hypothetical protein